MPSLNNNGGDAPEIRKPGRMLGRRAFLRAAATGGAGLVIAACSPQSPNGGTTPVASSTPLRLERDISTMPPAASPVIEQTNTLNTLEPVTPTVTEGATVAPPTIEGTSTVTPAPEAVPGRVEIAPEVREYAGGRLRELWLPWMKDFVREEGDALKVVRPNDQDIVSEGQAYGMVFAAAVGDKDTFDRLDSYAMSKLNSNGLMSWRLTVDGRPMDPNCATDAELDRLRSYYLAARKFSDPQHLERATVLAKAIRGTLLDSSGALRPGEWGGIDATDNPAYNPSYMDPAMLEEAELHDPEGAEIWVQAQARQREVVARFYRRYPDAMLLPNWINADGSFNEAMGPEAKLNGYDSMRVPLRMGIELTQGRAPANIEMARGVMERYARVWEAKGFEGVRDKMTVQGEIPPGMEATTWNNRITYLEGLPALLIKEDFGQLLQRIKQATNMGEQGYYVNSIELYTLALFSGDLA